jgi:hypothetical protein
MIKKILFIFIFLVVSTVTYADNVTFEWDPPAVTTGITKYILYGQATSPNPYVKLTEVPVGTHRVTVNITAGTYVYAVSANNTGLESERSNTVQYVPIEKPSGLRITTVTKTTTTVNVQDNK